MTEIQQLIIREVQQVPEAKLAILYDLIHYFRIGLAKDSANMRQPGLLKGKLGDAFFEPLSEDELQAWE